MAGKWQSKITDSTKKWRRQTEGGESTTDNPEYIIVSGAIIALSGIRAVMIKGSTVVVHYPLNVTISLETRSEDVQSAFNTVATALEAYSINPAPINDEGWKLNYPGIRRIY